MKAIISLIFLFFVACVYAEYRQETNLPKAKPRITVVNAKGDNLIEDIPHELEFKRMKVFIKKDVHSPTSYYIPKTKCDALDELQNLLPKDYYQRLVASYDKETEKDGGIADYAVEERLYDLENFLIKAWGLEKGNEIFYVKNKEPLALIWNLLEFRRVNDNSCEKTLTETFTE